MEDTQRDMQESRRAPVNLRQLPEYSCFYIHFGNILKKFLQSVCPQANTHHGRVPVLQLSVQVSDDMNLP